MSANKDTFRNSGTSEEQLLNDLSNVDLLVIDEIGVQPNQNQKSDHQPDRRSPLFFPNAQTGMLTNSNMEEMTKLLGERVMDRMLLVTVCG